MGWFDDWVAPIFSPGAAIGKITDIISPGNGQTVGSLVDPFGGALYAAGKPGVDYSLNNYGNLIDMFADPGNLVGRGSSDLGDMFPNTLRSSEAQSASDLIGGVASIYSPWIGAAVSGVGNELTHDYEGMTEEEKRKQKNAKLMKGGITYGAGSVANWLGGGNAPSTELGATTAPIGEGMYGSAGTSYFPNGEVASMAAATPVATASGAGGTIAGDTAINTAASAAESASGAGTAAGGSSLLGKSAIPLALLAANLGSSLLGANSSRQSAADATNNNREWWQANAFPNSSLMASKRAEAYADLGSKLAEAKRRMTEDAAKRGLRGGSLAGGLSNIERGGQRDYAKLANDLIQFQNTPLFSPTGTAMTPTTTAEQSIANTVSGLTGTVGGLYTYKNLFS